MARRKTQHAKSTETSDGMGAVKAMKQQHSKTMKQEHKTAAKSKSKDPNNQLDVDIPVENNAFTDDDHTSCASEENIAMQPTSEGLSNSSIKNSSDISSALSIDQYEHIDDHSQSASTGSNFDPESAGVESLMTNSDPQLPITPKKNRRKVTRRKTPSICSPVLLQTSFSASTTPSPAPSPSSAHQVSNQINSIVGVPGSNGQFICPSCNKVVDSQSEYTRHIRQHNFVEASAATHTCSLCGKVLSSASSLDRHMLVHSGERPFKCRICGMAFTTNGNMHRHMRTHHDGAAVAGDASSPMQVSDDEHTSSRKSRNYVKRKRLQSPLKPSSRKSGSSPGIVNSNGKRLHESDNCDEISTGAMHDGEWEEMYDKSASEHGTSVNSLSVPSSQKKQCTENNDLLLEKSDDAANNNWLKGSLSNDLDDSLRCLICSKTFLSKMGLHNHLDSHLPNELQCKECKDSKAFPSYQALLKHCRLSHSQSVGELKSDDDAIPSDSDIPPLHSATVGFHDLTFIDFSSVKFALIAKSACERNVRWPSSNYHIFQCRHCKKAFPSSGSLKMHVKAAHPAFANSKLAVLSRMKKSIPKCQKDEKNTILTVTASTCNQCHAAFASHHQLEMHCLRHQAAEQCATPYSTVEKNTSEDMDPAMADFAPQLNKENFLALFELQSKTKDAEVMPALTSLNPKQPFFQNRSSNGEMDDDDSEVSYLSKFQRTNLGTQWNKSLTKSENGSQCADMPFGSGNSNTGDLADIHSMITVTSTASAIPSMRMLGSSSFTSHVPSPPPSESRASPRLADSVTASPELPLEHNNALAPSSSANQSSPAKSTSSLSSTPSSMSASPAKSLTNDLGEDNADDKNTKEFACNQCPRVLPSLRALKAHNRIHLGGSPYHCNVCPFVSAEKSTLMRHLRTHNGERPYMCTICQYAFTTKANCERHLRTKHDRQDKEEVRGAMRYMAFDIREGGVDGSASFASSNACPHCNLQFAQAKLLKQHLHLQHNDMYSPKPFTCLNCKLRFSSHKTCLRHISKLHPDVLLPEDTVGTTLTSLSSFSPIDVRHKSLRGTVELPDSEPARSQSADGALAHDHPPVSAATASTSASNSVTILDLSSVPKGLAARPSSYPGALISATRAESQDRPLDPDDSDNDNQSSLESLINLTSSHIQAYDIPPQEQPLDLAVYPMDLSYNAASVDETLSPNSALGPMDLSASHRQQSRFSSANAPAATTHHLAVLPLTVNTHSFCQNSPSPFQSRAPSTFLSTPKPPSQVSPFPVQPSASPHVTNRYNQRAIPNLGASAFSPSGGHSTPHFSTSPGLINQSASINLSAPLLSMMPGLPSPGPQMSSPEAYTSPKVADRSGRKKSSSSNGHGRAHSASTSSNSFLLKKQKQRRYRTERPFRCAHCAAGFTLRSNMERHIKQQHPEFWASKARGRKLGPTNTMTVVTPSISISPIRPSSVPRNIPEMPQLMASTPAFPELLHMMQVDVEQPHITFHRADQQTPQKMSQVPSISLLKSDHSKTTISTEVKRAISKQIKQRKSHLELTAPAFPAGLANAALDAPSSVTTGSLSALSDNNSALGDDGSSSSDSSMVVALSPVVKVSETIFPPADEVVATSNPRPLPPQKPQPTVKLMDDADDTLPDLASVSKLLDTASQQNIQEMFRCSETVDDDDGSVDRIEGKDKEVPVDPFKVTHTQTMDDRYLFHDGNNCNKFTPVPADEVMISTSAESTPTKIGEKSKDGKRSAYNSAPNRVACPYCHRLFPWTSSLRRHILTHTGQKPHKCPICPLWFTTKSNCDRHLARKHNNPPQVKTGKPAMLAIFPPPSTSLVASTAASPTGSSSSLPDCTARNAPDRPYRCHFCLSSTFSTPKNLQKHLDSKHPGSLPLAQNQAGASQHLPELDKTDSLQELDTAGSFAAGIKIEAHSDGNSNSGSEQCWGESEESGEDVAVEGSPAPLTGSRPVKPMFFCFVCLKSFHEREWCLQHVRNKHPADHAQLALNTVTDNATESDDSTREQHIPEMPASVAGLLLASASSADSAIIPETTSHSIKLGTDNEDDEKQPEDVMDTTVVKKEDSTNSASPDPSQV